MRNVERSPLPPSFSVYLDLLRFGAAAMVLLFHVKMLQIGPVAMRSLIPNHGHDFVILFFVLSGYVIAATTDRKRDEGLRGYALDRMARVYSVAVPVLLFCTLLALLLPRWIDPMGYWMPESEHAIAIVPLNLLFLGQVWWLRLQPFADYPYWSLTFEVFYYAMFGVFMFVKGWLRIVLLTALAVLAGPKILLLLPCWIAGVLTYRFRDAWQLSRGGALFAAFVVPVAILFALNAIGFGRASRALLESVLSADVRDRLDVSATFLIDYATACVVAIHLYAIRFVRFEWNDRLQGVVRSGAAMSFTLYLLHHPLLAVVTAIFRNERANGAAMTCAVIVVPLICLAVARVTEDRRHVLRHWLEVLLHRSAGFGFTSFR